MASKKSTKKRSGKKRSATGGKKRSAAGGGKRGVAATPRKGGETTFTAHFRPEDPRDLAGARRRLQAAGLSILGKTAAGGLVVEATRGQIEGLTKLQIKETRVRRQVNRADGLVTRRSYLGPASEAAPPLGAGQTGRFLFPVPFSYWQTPSAYPPSVPYYRLHPSRDLPRIFGVESLHAAGVRGSGVRVVMIDSGFYRHPYYADAGLHGGAVPSITTHSVLPSSDPEVDDVGHGTGIAANTLALAPRCDFHHVKDDDDPLAAMVIARSLSPSIITCSWGWSEDYVEQVFTQMPNSGAATYLSDLQAEITGAIQDGIVVLFAAGNGNGPGSWPSSVPGVICVGGALVEEDLDLVASSYATSFASLVTPGRICPDVCGIVGPAPHGILLTLPTQPNNLFDSQFSAADGTQPGDGWLIASGTSSATPQLAGIAALLIEMHGSLDAAQMLARFRDMAVSVQHGASATGHPATSARPNAATGYGLVTFRRPQREGGYTGLA